MALQLAYNLWQYDRQNKNVEKIVKAAADLYDKVAGFGDTFSSLGDLIARLSGAFEKARLQLYDGKGNVMRRIEATQVARRNTQKEYQRPRRPCVDQLRG